MKRLMVFGIIAVFILGWMCSTAYSLLDSSKHTSVERDLAAPITEPTPEENTPNTAVKALSALFPKEPEELPSPYDRIKESQISVFQNRIVIDLENAEWATFTDTNSMDPVIDLGANAIEIVPQGPENIHVGDIVSYESKFAKGTIIHRVVEIGHDSSGWYAKMKGDNLSAIDPGKVRFEQIRRVVVGILY